VHSVARHLGISDEQAQDAIRAAGQPRGFAFVWRRFEISDLPAPMLACVMATVPANELIRRTVKSQEDDPRMPAILEDDAWSTWLGEGDATPATANAVLRTMEGVNW
jgi:putative SOS response-associated peptidase YedK